MALDGKPLDSDPYAGYVVDDSDLEYSECSGDESSDEELTPGDIHVRQQKCGGHSVTKGPEEESEDEFEKEMDMEAEKLLNTFLKKSTKGFTRGPEKSQDPPATSNGLEESPSKTNKDDNTFYDEIYFDSSEDEEDNNGGGCGEDNGRRKGKKVLKLTNDELFYDPNMDDEDEKWVQRQRKAYHNVNVSAKLTKKKTISGNTAASLEEGATSKPTPTETTPTHSDAILNCPACMTTLCLDCQRHDIYSDQYRAMFVLNCKIIKDQVLKYRPKQFKRKRKATNQDQSQSEDHELYKPVHCAICSTEVAVYDKDEVFHFFNVIGSAS